MKDLKARFLVRRVWGGYPTQRLRATSKTFGEVILVLFKEGNTLTLLMAKVKKEKQAQRELRALSVIRIHKQRPWIEQNWRWQKSQLRTGQIQVRTGHKPKAGYTCRMVTYAILVELQRRLRRYRTIVLSLVGAGNPSLNRRICLCVQDGGEWGWASGCPCCSGSPRFGIAEHGKKRKTRNLPSSTSKIVQGWIGRT